MSKSAPSLQRDRVRVIEERVRVSRERERVCVRSPTHNMAALWQLVVSPAGLSRSNQSGTKWKGIRLVWGTFRKNMDTLCVLTFKCVYSAGTYKSFVWGSSESGESARATERCRSECECVLVCSMYMAMYMYVSMYLYIIYRRAIEWETPYESMRMRERARVKSESKSPQSVALG